MIEGTPGTPFEGEVLIRRLRWASDESGFAVVDADRDGDEVVLVGPLAHLEARERVRIAGVWQDDRRFGMQIKVATAEPLAPAGDAALIAYLERVKHVGPARAARLLARHGDAVLDAIDRDPHAAFRAVGLNPRRANEAFAPGTGCAPAARCTSCSPRTGSPIWCRGSPSTTAIAPTTSCASGRTS
jgi:exodeoxyribonuclease V alpha subunit